MEFYKYMAPTMIERLVEHIDQVVTAKQDSDEIKKEVYENELIKELKEILFYYLSHYPLEGKHCRIVMTYIPFEELNFTTMLPYNLSKLSLKRY